MTRFWITLDQAVHFVLKVLELANGEEIYIPKIPSMRITDLAKAIAPNCTHKVIGIRPGEKIHETLIGEDEGRNTVEYNECFVIIQSIPEKEPSSGKRCSEGFKYASNDNPDIISVEYLQNVLERIADDYSVEKSRWSLEDIV